MAGVRAQMAFALGMRNRLALQDGHAPPMAHPPQDLLTHSSAWAVPHGSHPAGGRRRSTNVDEFTNLGMLHNMPMPDGSPGGGYPGAMGPHGHTMYGAGLPPTGQGPGAGGLRGQAAAAAKPPRPPVGEVRLRLVAVAPPARSGQALYAVVRCGPHWVRTQEMAVQGSGLPQCPLTGTPMQPVAWEVRLPLYDPATLLTVGVFEVQSTMVSRGHEMEWFEAQLHVLLQA